MVGLGAGMDLRVVAKVGAHGVLYTVAGIAACLAIGKLLAKALKVSADVGTLISVGTAICGGSAIAAMVPVLRPKEHEVSVALATVFLLNAIALFLFPAVGHAVGLSETQFGLWSALAIHDTSSVVGAAVAYGGAAVGVATTVKLARALWIVPLTIGIAQVRRLREPNAVAGKAKRPWFILGFIVAAALVTWVPVLRPAGQVVSGLSKQLLVLTLFLIGANLSRDALRSVGLRPLLQGGLLWGAMGSLSLAAILLGWISVIARPSVGGNTGAREAFGGAQGDSMIPYFTAPSLELGPIGLHPFGVLVAAGVMTASYLSLRAAKQDGQDPAALNAFSTWALIAGVVGAHVVHLVFYHPEELSRGPLQILKVWDGLSSTGGVIGGVLAAAVFFRTRGHRFWSYADALALGLAPGWAIARLGCFVTHDHPGVHSSFFLAVQFPDGPRHDLGLYDALALFAIAAVLFVLRRRDLLRGRLMAVLAVLYGASRFGLDFLRARHLSYVDARYLGLTPAQFACIFLLAFGFYRLARPVPATIAA